MLNGIIKQRKRDDSGNRPYFSFGLSSLLQKFISDIISCTATWVKSWPFPQQYTIAIQVLLYKQHIACLQFLYLSELYQRGDFVYLLKNVHNLSIDVFRTNGVLVSFFSFLLWLFFWNFPQNQHIYMFRLLMNPLMKN